MKDKYRRITYFAVFVVYAAPATAEEHTGNVSTLTLQAAEIADVASDLERDSADAGGTLRNGVYPTEAILFEGEEKKPVARRRGPEEHLVELEASYSEANSMGGEVGAAGTRRGYFETRVKSAVGGGLPELEAKLAVSSFDPDANERFSDASKRYYKFGIRGSAGPLQYGVKYFSVGEEFERSKEKGHESADKPKKDREGTEAWVAKEFGNVGIKTFATRYHDNVADNPDRARLTDQKAGATFTYTISAWPYLGVSTTYSRGIRTSSLEPQGRDSFQGPVETVSNALTYSSDKWSGSLSVEHATGATFSGPADVVTYYLGASYFPSDAFSITPDVTWTEEQYKALSVNTRSRSAGLTVTYRPPKTKLMFTVTGGHMTTSNPDWGFANEYFYAYAGVDFPMQTASPGAKVSVQFGYDRYTDHIYSSANTSDRAVIVNFRAPFD